MKLNCHSPVVIRLKIQEQSELNFASRIIQSPFAIGNCSLPMGQGGDSAGVSGNTHQPAPGRAMPTKLANDRMRIPQGSA